MNVNSGHLLRIHSRNHSQVDGGGTFPRIELSSVKERIREYVSPNVCSVAEVEGYAILINQQWAVSVSGDNLENCLASLLKNWNSVATELGTTVIGDLQIPVGANTGTLIEHVLPPAETRTFSAPIGTVVIVHWTGDNRTGVGPCLNFVRGNSMNQVNAGIEFQRCVLATVKELNYDVRTEFPSPGDTWIDRIATWLGSAHRHLPRPDMVVRHGEKTVMVEVKAYPILMGPLIQARHYADYYDAPILICLPDDVFPQILSSVRESAEENGIALTPIGEIGERLRDLLEAA